MRTLVRSRSGKLLRKILQICLARESVALPHLGDALEREQEGMRSIGGALQIILARNRLEQLLDRREQITRSAELLIQTIHCGFELVNFFRHGTYLKIQSQKKTLS